MNKNIQHRRAVETLGLSGNGDELIISQINQLIHNHQVGQPYSYNTLLRIKDKIDTYLVKRDVQGRRRA